MIKYISV